MDKAASFHQSIFRTICSLSWLCLLLQCAFVSADSASNSTDLPRLVTYRPGDVDRSTHNGVFVLSFGEEAVLLLYGDLFTNETRLWLTDQTTCSGDGVNLHSLGPLQMLSENGTRANITVPASTPPGNYRFCISDSASEATPKFLQGSIDENDHTLQLLIVDDDSSSNTPLLPLGVNIVFIIILICLSGTFSGLNLGLMSLDPTTLKIVMESGSGRQRTYAKLIYRVRKYGNYLLCTLLLGNVLVNNTLTILLNSVLGSGAWAIVASTFAIVIFGEIIPQAICSRHALTIGAYTIWLTYIFMAITFPLSLPISIVLHFILGKEIGAVYTRDELLGLLKVTEDHHDIGKDEVQIISGALKFKEKTAENVMTKFEYVYCLDIQCVLDFKTMREIYDSGFSRIPVYEETKSNIVGVLYAKDLTFVDPDDETPLKQVLDFYKRELTSVYNDSKLNELLEEFAGGKCHLALVNSVVQEGEGDPQLEVVGVVTLEDIVEEILQLEIVDETDRIMDNRSLKPRKRNQVDIGGFMGEAPVDRPHISSQQRLAIYQFLSSSVDAFKSDKVRPNILKQMLGHDVGVHRYTHEELQTRNHTLYRTDVPATSFTLVLEGHVEVEVGRDGMKFEAGPFHHFGVQALEAASSSDTTTQDYVPDFTVRPTSNCLVLIVTCSQYQDALKATKFQKIKEESPAANHHKYPSPKPSHHQYVSPNRFTPPNLHTTKSKSDTHLKPIPKRMSLGMLRRSGGNGGSEVERLLPDESSSEEEEERKHESDNILARNNHSLPDDTQRSISALSHSQMVVEVELHEMASDDTNSHTTTASPSLQAHLSLIEEDEEDSQQQPLDSTKL